MTLRKRWKTRFLCIPLACALGCAHAPQKDEPRATAAVMAEVKKEKEAEPVAEPPPQPPAKKGLVQHVKDDWGDTGGNLLEDIMGLWAKEDAAHNLIVLGGAGGLAAVSVDKWDHPIAKHHTRYGALGDWADVGYVLGKPSLHFGVTGLFYTHAKLADDPESLETSKRLAEALMLNGATTLLLKGAVNRTRPNNGTFSFPSGHASSSFATAAVLDGMYGHRVGIPLYLLSSFVALSRIDARAHYLSDVIFGAALGYVFGRTVTKVHERKLLGFDVAPWVDPGNGAGGIMFQRRF